jgi:hypothetical protein
MSKMSAKLACRIINVDADNARGFSRRATSVNGSVIRDRLYLPL